MEVRFIWSAAVNHLPSFCHYRNNRHNTKAKYKIPKPKINNNFTIILLPSRPLLQNSIMRLRGLKKCRKMQTPELWHLTHLALTAVIIMPVATFNHFHWLLAIKKKKEIWTVTRSLGLEHPPIIHTSNGEVDVSLCAVRVSG